VIPASHTFDQQIPWGSHALLDPLWSTEVQDVIHDGCEATRIQKVSREIVHSPIALEHLRVCWRKPNDDYNCGKCEKCLRTQINLRLCDALDRCATFPRQIDLDLLRRLCLRNENEACFVRENLHAVERAGDAPLAAVLKEVLTRYARRRRPVRQWIDRVDRGLLGGSGLATLRRWRRRVTQRR
jgi:hypothetical protein